METGAAMSIKEIADLLFAARERIDFYWNFYVVVVIAVIGWLVSFKKTLTLSMKLLVSVGLIRSNTDLTEPVAWRTDPSAAFCDTAHICSAVCANVSLERIGPTCQRRLLDRCHNELPGS